MDGERAVVQSVVDAKSYLVRSGNVRRKGYIVHIGRRKC
jgi:hypothetical protein